MIVSPSRSPSRHVTGFRARIFLPASPGTSPLATIYVLAPAGADDRSMSADAAAWLGAAPRVRSSSEVTSSAVVVVPVEESDRLSQLVEAVDASLDAEPKRRWRTLVALPGTGAQALPAALRDRSPFGTIAIWGDPSREALRAAVRAALPSSEAPSSKPLVYVTVLTDGSSQVAAEAHALADELFRRGVPYRLHLEGPGGRVADRITACLQYALPTTRAA